MSKWDKIGNLAREIILYNHLADRFKKIYFITYGQTGEENKYRKLLKPNIEILAKRISFLPNKLYSILIPFLYANIFKKVDILKTNQMSSSLSAILTQLIFKNKLIVRCGYELLRNYQLKNKTWIKIEYVRWLEKYAYMLAKQIIITSAENKEFILNNFNVSSNKISVIYNYIDTSLFCPIEQIKKEENRLCYVGRLEKFKNVDNLIKAISVLPAYLVIYGNGPEKNNLERLANKLKADVRFMGTVPNDKLPEELNKCSIFVLPSLFEGNPKVLLEAMSCALACIGTNVEGIKNVISAGEDGILCDTTIESIRASIVMLLEDKSMRELIGTRARETALIKYSLNNILNDELHIYNSL